MLGPDRVLIADPEGRIEGIISREEAGEDVEYHAGILTPGFVNCHCHLDLSHLRGRIPEKTGLVGFVSLIMKERDRAEAGEILEAMEGAEKEMRAAGIVAVGDICSGPASIEVKKNSVLCWRNFVEVTGFTDSNAALRLDRSEKLLDAFSSSLPFQSSVLSPHAPYSVSVSLMKRINERTAGQVITIHNQESAEENKLFREGTGGFHSLYQDLNIDISGFLAPGCSSFRHWLPKFDLHQQIIAVHNTFTDEADLDVLLQNKDKDCRVIFCLCPAANLFIEGRLPPVNMLLSHGVQVVLGTDSLASNHRLSILSEMQILQKECQVPVNVLLQWATQNGARAMRMENELGSFEKGKKPGVLWLNKATAEDILSAEVIRLF